MPIHPEAGRESPERAVTATPAEERPYSSIDVTPTMLSHKRSLSSRPSSDASEYIMEEMGSEYEAPSR